MKVLPRTSTLKASVVVVHDDAFGSVAAVAVVAAVELVVADSTILVQR